MSESYQGSRNDDDSLPVEIEKEVSRFPPNVWGTFDRLSVWQNDQELQGKCREWVYKNRVRKGQRRATIEDFMDYYNTIAFKELNYPDNFTISKGTAHAGLLLMGFRRRGAKGGIFSDGYDREDVAQYADQVLPTAPC